MFIGGSHRVFVVSIAVGAHDEGTGRGSAACINVVNHLLPIEATVDGDTDRVIASDWVYSRQGDGSLIQGLAVCCRDVLALATILASLA